MDALTAFYLHPCYRALENKEIWRARVRLDDIVCRISKIMSECNLTTRVVCSDGYLHYKECIEANVFEQDGYDCPCTCICTIIGNLMNEGIELLNKIKEGGGNINW